MLFNSMEFLLFFPITVIIYFMLPSKAKNVELLIMSYIFYMGWNAKYSLLLLTVTSTTYLTALLLERDKWRLMRKKLLIICISINLALLCFFKYGNFILENLNKLTGGEFSTLNVLLPVGISFYIFQAMGYVVDVYRGELRAEKNFVTYALFVSFFPQLVAGPIERSSNLLKQMKENHCFDYCRVREGLLLMLWGLFQKLVIADRVAILVDRVFNNYTSYYGACRAVAAIFFAIQIYCDFGGYTNIAIGAAKVMGFSLVNNFDSPYFAVSIKDFWRRWHISLSQWFRDYVYISLGGSRCSRIKKYRNLMFTFLLSGLWHGAGWNFVVWGGMHGAYQIIGEALEPLKKKIYVVLNIDETTDLHRLWRQIITFVLVDIAWIIFRMSSLKDGLAFISGMVSDFNLYMLIRDPVPIFAAMGFSINELAVLLAGLLLLWGVDLCRKKVYIPEWLAEQNAPARWIIYISLLFLILIYGIYGTDYAQTQFIYFQF